MSAMDFTGRDFSLTAALSHFSDPQLVELLVARPDLAAPPPKDLAILAARASSWPSLMAATAHLNQAARQIIETLCLLPQPTTVTNLAAVLGGDTTGGDLDPLLDRLCSLALLFRSGPTVRLHPDLAHLTYPANLGPPVTSVLAAQTVAGLHDIAHHLGVAPGRTKADTIATLTDALVEPDRVWRAVEQGPAGTIGLATRLAVDHPVATVPAGTYHLRGDSPLGWLLEAGLVATTSWDTVVMPGEVGLALRGGRPFPDFQVQPPSLPWTPVDPALVDAAGTEQALRLVADVIAILDSWDETPPKLLKAGGMGVRDVRRAAALTGRSETEAAQLIELTAVAGLAGWDIAAECLLPRPDYDNWLNLDTARQWGALVEAWAGSDLHFAMAGSSGPGGKAIPPLQIACGEKFAAARRRLVLATRAEGEPGQAVVPEAVTMRVRWEAPSLWSDGPAGPGEIGAWVEQELELLGLVARGALSTIGRMVAAGDTWGAAAELATRTAPVDAQFVIQADLTVVATGQLPCAVRGDLELMADLESAGAASVFRLSEQSLRRAFDAGWTALEIARFLEAHATRGVPQPLSYLVEDIGRRHGRLRVGSATSYLRGDDPALLAELLGARRAAKLGLRPLAPTVLVSSAPPETVIAVMRAAGYLPAQEDSTGAIVFTGPARRRAPADRPYAWTIHPGGSGAPPDGDGPDLTALVRTLRAAGSLGGAGSGGPGGGARSGGPGGGARPAAAGHPSAPRPFPPIGPADATAPFPPLDLLQDLEVRPSEIAMGPMEIEELLELAMMEDWRVRLEYVNQKGRLQVINAEVESTDGSDVIVGVAPSFRLLTLAFSRIRWARILTEAEEEGL